MPMLDNALAALATGHAARAIIGPALPLQPLSNRKRPLVLISLYFTSISFVISDMEGQ
jgi:hypothetical protein